MSKATIKEQLRRNAVAFISLFIAVTGLLYNTWRNEHSELNRNHRWASFQVLILVGDLQEIVFLSYYDPDESMAGDFRRGWSKVLLIRDLAMVLGGPASQAADELHATWDDNWAGLEKRNKSSLDEIQASIDALRGEMVTVLQDLE